MLKDTIPGRRRVVESRRQTVIPEDRPRALTVPCSKSGKVGKDDLQGMVGRFNPMGVGRRTREIMENIRLGAR